MLRRNKKKRFIIKVLEVSLLVLAACLIFAYISSQQKPHTPQPSAMAQSSLTPTAAPTPLPSSPGLSAAVQDALIGTYGKYGIVVQNLATGESYYQNEKIIYNSGSLYKLWVMATVYQEIQQGQLKEQDVLSKDVYALTKEFGVSPDPTEQTSGTISMTVGDALYQMITISDNNAALLLTDRVSIPKIQAFMSAHHFINSKVGRKDKPPITTAYDIALFFNQLYKGQLANADYTNEMLTLLKQQKLNEKLPKYLPDDVVIAHKTGELDDVSHDSGIIYGPSGDYIIVVLSQSQDPDLANERIAEISQNVYNYFAQTPTPQDE